MPRIAITEVTASPSAHPASSGSTAARLEPGFVTLRFRLVSSDERSLEALRYSRRAMLREEWTRGVEEGQPSLEEAVFTAFDVVWTVPAGARDRSRELLEELVVRANRALADMSAAGRASRAPGRLRSP
jgi:hypothetical protein